MKAHMLALAMFSRLASTAAAAVDRALALRRIRVAAADRLIDSQDEIQAYKAAGFNAIVLYDTDEGFLLKSEERIAYEASVARARRLRIILGKATEPFTTPAPSLSTSRRRALAVASADEVADDEIRERLQLWDRYADDRIVAVFFLHDDAFFLRVPVERQRHLYQLARERPRDDRGVRYAATARGGCGVLLIRSTISFSSWIRSTSAAPSECASTI